METVTQRPSNRPAFERVETTAFATSAPEYPLSRLGGGVMSECVNFQITDEGLETRKARQKCPSETLPATGTEYLFFEIDGNEYCLQINLAMLKNLYPDKSGIYVWKDIGKIYALGANKAVPANNYTILDGSTIKNDTIDTLGVTPPPSPPYVIPPAPTATDPNYRRIAVSFSKKDSSGITIKDSGIVNSLDVKAAARVSMSAYTMDPSWTLCVYMTNALYTIENGRKIATGADPGIYYLLWEIPYTELPTPSNSIEYNSGGQDPDKFAITLTNYGTDKNPAYDIEWSAPANTGMDAYDSQLAIATQADNSMLAPMQNVRCYANGRLWGFTDTAITYSQGAGTIYQEQTSALNSIKTNLGRINDIDVLDGDLFAFCQRGVLRIANSDPAAQPETISTFGSPGVRLVSINQYGIFALTPNLGLMVLASGSLAYSETWNGLNFNSLVDTSKIADIRHHNGELYFLLGDERGTLYATHLLEGKGISETSVYRKTPRFLCPGNRTGIGIACTDVPPAPDGQMSLWNDAGDWPGQETEAKIEARAAFVRHATNGWAQAGDTEVWGEIGGADVRAGVACVMDGRVETWSREPFPGVPGERADTRLVFRPPTRTLNNGGRRAIGRTLETVLTIDVPGTAPAQKVLKVTLNGLRQEETSNPGYLPNARDQENYLLEETAALMLVTESETENQ
jgi:hypothetical protein